MPIKTEDDISRANQDGTFGDSKTTYIIGLDRVSIEEAQLHVLRIFLNNGTTTVVNFATKKTLNKMYYTLRCCLGIKTHQQAVDFFKQTLKIRGRKRLLKALLKKNRRERQKQEKLYQLQKARELQGLDNITKKNELSSHPTKLVTLETSTAPERSACTTDTSIQAYETTRINKTIIRRRKRPEDELKSWPLEKLLLPKFRSNIDVQKELLRRSQLAQSTT